MSGKLKAKNRRQFKNALQYMKNIIKLSALILISAVGALAQTPTSTVKFDSETISGLGARNIGSATMSGRIAALDAVQEGSRLTLYVGAASGGVWKSTNGGTTFKPVFDKPSTLIQLIDCLSHFSRISSTGIFSTLKNDFSLKEIISKIILEDAGTPLLPGSTFFSKMCPFLVGLFFLLIIPIDYSSIRVGDFYSIFIKLLFNILIKIAF